MKPALMRWSGSSLALLTIQLVLVSSIAGKYLYQRWTCPRVWTRAVAVDPVSLLRGRYLSLRLTVDGCRSTLPSARQAAFGRNVDGSANQSPYAVAAPQTVQFPAHLLARDNKLSAIALAAGENPARGQMVLATPVRLASFLGPFVAVKSGPPVAASLDSLVGWRCAVLRAGA